MQKLIQAVKKETFSYAFPEQVSDLLKAGHRNIIIFRLI